MHVLWGTTTLPGCGGGYEYKTHPTLICFVSRRGDGRKCQAIISFPVVQTSITTHTVVHTLKHKEIQAALVFMLSSINNFWIFPYLQLTMRVFY
jgi:hypothetical protein